MSRILVVGPTRITESFVAWIEERGHTVVRVDHVDMAMEVTRKRPPDGVVTEVRVDGGDGIGLLWHLRREGFSIPVYIQSSSGRYLIPEVGEVDLFEYVKKNFGTFATFHPKGVHTFEEVRTFADSLTPG